MQERQRRADGGQAWRKTAPGGPGHSPRWPGVRGVNEALMADADGHPEDNVSTKYQFEKAACGRRFNRRKDEVREA